MTGLLLTAAAAVVAVPGTAAAATLKVTYTGPDSAPYRAPTKLSAVIALGDSGYAGATVTFRVGTASCTATSAGDGSASCTLAPADKPGYYGVSVRAESDAGRVGTFSTFRIEKAATTLAYTGTKYIANDEPARLAAVLKDGAGQAVENRTVQFALGTGANEQKCDAATDTGGTASCTVAKVDQPLNENGTVPVSGAFAGDDYYLSSGDSATVLLQYVTGRAYGAFAAVDLLLFPVTLPPQPDTGAVRTARATVTKPPCSAEIDAPGLEFDAVCADVTTSLAPGTSVAHTTVESARIGLPGLPVIELSGVEAVSTSTCQKAAGTTGLTLKIAGKQIDVPDVPNTEIDLGLARLVVNEQIPVADADHGLTVNAVHLQDAAGLIDVVVGSATSDAHNCPPTA
ncbi:choice-of-anchor P family protein [Streptomyces albiflavescens]|uniref:choice-of-anchor P family protein n=1 Tax=Streptomyces albiflavescens TaxID=1623582 RepID=UPI00166B259F|nr:choice-of-anchor P family protein [Streptomyces albiflavescens]